MEDLSDEVMAIILSWIPPVELLQSGALVSKYLARQITLHWTRPDEANQVTREELTNHQIHRCWAFRYSSFVSLNAALPSFLEYGSVLSSKAKACELLERGILRVCAASTTHHTHEALEHVLRVHAATNEGGTTWWSSKPSTFQESNEVLLFTTKYPLALLSRLRIKPLFRDHTNNPRTCYTWKTTVIRAYHLPLESLFDPNALDRTQAGFPCLIPAPQMCHEQQSDLAKRLIDGISQVMDDELADDDIETIRDLLGSSTPVVEIRESNISIDRSGFLTFELSTRERSVVANVITITLMGKNYEQHTGEGYYAGVESVECEGIPLYETSEQSRPRTGRGFSRGRG